MHIYWQVGDTKTISKGRALRLANGDLSKIKFSFFSEAWQDKIFSMEPFENFDQLAIARCQQLRQGCDHLCLWLSSGYDSNTALNYFCRSKKKVDALIIYSRPVNEHEFDFALERAKHYKKNFNPACEIIHVPISTNHVHKIYNGKGKDWVDGPGFNMRFTKTSLLWQTEEHDEIRKAMDRYKGVRYDVTGFEKPRVSIHDGQWIMMRPDIMVLDTWSPHFKGFYCDHDCFDLYLKTHYMVAEWFESFPELTNQIVHQVQSHEKMYREWNIAAGRDPVDNWYSVNGWGKHLFTNNTISPDSKEYVKNFQDTSAYKIYNEGIDFMKDLLDWDGKENLWPKTFLQDDGKILRKVKHKNYE